MNTTHPERQEPLDPDGQLSDADFIEDASIDIEDPAADSDLDAATGVPETEWLPAEVAPIADESLWASADEITATNFELLVARFQRPLIAYFYRHTRDYEMAQDFTQEVFLRVYFKYPGRGIAIHTPQASSLVFRVANNLAIDEWRKRKLIEIPLSKLLERPEGESAFDDPEQTGFEDYLAEHAIMNAAMARLPEKYRQLLEQLYFFEFSYEKMAEALGVPLGTLKSNLNRARKRLSTLYRQEEADPETPTQQAP